MTWDLHVHQPRQYVYTHFRLINTTPLQTKQVCSYVTLLSFDKVNDHEICIVNLYFSISISGNQILFLTVLLSQNRNTTVTIFITTLILLIIIISVVSFIIIPLFISRRDTIVTRGPDQYKQEGGEGKLSKAAGQAAEKRQYQMLTSATARPRSILTTSREFPCVKPSLQKRSISHRTRDLDDL